MSQAGGSGAAVWGIFGGIAVAVICLSVAVLSSPFGAGGIATIKFGRARVSVAPMPAAGVTGAWETPTSGLKPGFVIGFRAGVKAGAAGKGGGLEDINVDGIPGNLKRNYSIGYRGGYSAGVRVGELSATNPPPRTYD